MPKREPNTEWPGLPNYTGPTEGWFTLLHHEGPHYEYSNNVLERVYYINTQKPEHERAIRLRHIRFVSAEMPTALAEYERVKATARAEYRRVTATALAEYERVTATALAEYERVKATARAEYRRVTATALAEYERETAPALAAMDDEIRRLIPDCRWNGQTLVFEEPANA